MENEQLLIDLTDPGEQVKPGVSFTPSGPHVQDADESLLDQIDTELQQASLPQLPLPMDRVIDMLDQRIAELKRRRENRETPWSEASNDMEEVDILSGESLLSYQVKSHPVPSPRTKLPTMTPAPIPAKRTSKASSRSSTLLLSGELPLGQQQNPPWEDPTLSPQMQQRMKDLYLKGCKDGSQFGSHAGSQIGSRAGSRAGSLPNAVSSMDKVRQYLSSTGQDATQIIVEEGEGQTNKAGATIANPTDPATFIATFPMSDNDSIELKRVAARKETKALQKVKEKAKKAYNRQKGVVKRTINVFYANGDNEDWDMGDLNDRLAEQTRLMQDKFAIYLANIINDSEEQVARQEFNPRLVEATEVLSLADALAKYQTVQKNKAENLKKEIENKLAMASSSGALPKGSHPLPEVITTAMSSTPTVSTTFVSESMTNFASEPPVSTPITGVSSTTSSTATTYASIIFPPTTSLHHANPFKWSATSSASTTVTTLAPSRPITSTGALKSFAPTKIVNNSPFQAFEPTAAFDLTKKSMPEWLSKPLPKFQETSKVKPTFAKTFTSGKISDIGSDREADIRPERRPPGDVYLSPKGRGRGRGQPPPGSQKDFVQNFERPTTRSQTQQRQKADHVQKQPTQEEINLINKQKEVLDREQNLHRQQADLKHQQDEFERQRRKRVDFEAEELRKLKLENAKMRGEISDLRRPDNLGVAFSSAPTVVQPPAAPQLPMFQPPPTFQPQQNQPRVPMPGSNALPRGNLSGGVYVASQHPQQQQQNLTQVPLNSYAPQPQELPPPLNSGAFWGNPTTIANQLPPDAPYGQRYLPPGQINYHENDNQTNEQRPFIKPIVHKFDGTTKTDEWTKFRAFFDTAVGSRRMPDNQKLLLLLDLLDGEPKKIADRIAGEEYTTRAYTEVWHVLEEHYGRLIKAKKDALHRLETFPKIKSFTKENALEFSSLLSTIIRKYTTREHGLIDDGGVLSSLAKKVVPESEVVQYFQKIAEYHRPDTLLEFYNYIEAKRVALNLTSAHFTTTGAKGQTHIAQDSYSRRDEEDSDDEHVLIGQSGSNFDTRREKSDSTKKVSFDLRRKNSEKGDFSGGGEDPKLCVCCKAAHPLWKCEEFKVMTTAKRYSIVRRSRSCYHCLGPAHDSRDCTWKKDVKCGLEDCERYHHHLLHNWKSLGLISIEEYHETGEIPDEGQEADARINHVTVAFAKGKEYISIRTATILLTGPNGKPHRCLAALDTGSNSTNVDADLAKQLGFRVNARDITREINFMERLVNVTSDHVSFMIGPVDGRVSYPIQGYTIKDLISGTPVIDWNEAAKTYPHLRGADIPKPDKRDKVQVLLGADYMHLMAVSNSIIGRDFEPVAEYCRLGWAFTGRIKNCQIIGGNDMHFGIATTNVVAFSTFMNHEKSHLKLSDMMKKKEVSNPEEEVRQALTSSAAHTDRGVGLNLCTYISMTPTIDFESERKLHELHELIENHWELEAIGLVEKIPSFSGDVKEKPIKQWSKAEKESDSKLKVKYISDKKQFQMSVPWKKPRPDLPNNRFPVRSRQDGVLAKYTKEEQELIQKTFDSYLEKGYIRKLQEHEKYDIDAFYLPFFCVVNPKSDTTPVRVVWDCAARFEHNGVKKSLNSEIELTPNRLQDLFKILLRMRKFKYVVLSDVSEMFLKILLDPADRRYHRFHFNKEEYEWLVILFGNLASPNGSQKVIQLNCDINGQDLLEALESIRNSLYMDDVADSRPEQEQALLLVQQLIVLFQACGMTVQKFYSNSELVCQNTDQTLLAKQIHFEGASHDVVYSVGRVLGMSYTVPEDCLTYAGKFKDVRNWVKGKVDIDLDNETEQEGWTKRKLAQVSASVFDPLGLISPFLVRSKVIMQEVWKLKIDWGAKLPESICIPWQAWLEQFGDVPDFKIPRWSGLKAKGTPYQIHTFCDASEEGTCAAVYIRVKTGHDITTNLLAAKSRVTPLKAESISRSELVACVMAVRLCAAVKETYPASPEDTFFWTDSEVCLRWINTPAKSFKAFVAHRIGEIQTFTEPRQWQHVPGVENPADVGTRHITAAELQDSQVWWEGPSFLRSSLDLWPKTKILQELESKELKATIFLTVEHLKKANLDKLEQAHPRHFSVSKFGSGLNKCLQLWARLLQAKRLFLLKREDRPLVRPLHLRSFEIEDARTFLAKQSQLEFYPEEVGLMSKNFQPLAEIRGNHSSAILQFNPFLDPAGVIRSRSRLTNIPGLSYEKAHPIVLHRKSDYTRLLVEAAHVEHEHPVGIQAMKASIQNEFAIVGLGTLCKQVQFRCTECRKLKAPIIYQQMAPLPERRIGTKLKSFDNVGLDFAGPFDIKMGLGKIRKKVYVLVLTCMVTRGVHLEATGGMDTVHVINALSRFVDVRGVPTTLTSDNQTSFRKADKEITEWYRTVNWNQVQQATGVGFRPSSNGIEWKFNPPNAPHFGGIFEIIVKALKRALKTILGRADLDEEAFRTAVSKVAYMLNRRPITPSGSIHDNKPLTPNSFIFGDLDDAVFPPDFPEDQRTNLDRKLKLQVEVQKFVWKRFFLEFVPLLGPRKRWSQEKENLEVGEVVIELDENQPRGKWRLMRVSKVFPSKDGLVRHVEVMSTDNKAYKRPIAKLIPIVRN